MENQAPMVLLGNKPKISTSILNMMDQMDQCLSSKIFKIHPNKSQAKTITLKYISKR